MDGISADACFEVRSMYRVQCKSRSAAHAWTNFGVYGSESAAMRAAELIAARYPIVRVIDRFGRVLYVF